MALFQLKLLADFYQLMDKTCQVRRQIAERVLKGIAIRPHFGVSLENAKVRKCFRCSQYCRFVFSLLVENDRREAEESRYLNLVIPQIHMLSEYPYRYSPI